MQLISMSYHRLQCYISFESFYVMYYSKVIYLSYLLSDFLQNFAPSPLAFPDKLFPLEFSSPGLRGGVIQDLGAYLDLEIPYVIT